MPHRRGHREWSDREWKRAGDQERFWDNEEDYDPRSSLRQYRDWENEEGMERGRQERGPGRSYRSPRYGSQMDYKGERYRSPGYNRNWERPQQQDWDYDEVTDWGRRPMEVGRYDDEWSQRYQRSFDTEDEGGWETGPGWTYIEETWWVVPGPYEGIGPKGYRRSDERIHEEVCERLTRHGRLDASEIELEVRDGEVTLSGMVQRRQEKRLAEDIAESVSGVHDVHNHLRVQGAGRSQEMRSGWRAGEERRTGGETMRAQSGLQSGMQTGTHSEIRSQIREGMQVLGSDGELIGVVKEIAANDFLVDRTMERDIYVPFSACSSISEGRVNLNLRAIDINQQNWRMPEILGGTE